MKTRILDNNLFGGVYTDEFLKKNKDNIINGSIVSAWNLTDVQCSSDMILAIFDNGNWIESATNEEILEFNNTNFKINRDLLLKQGIEVTFNTNDYWFNEKYLSDFISLINVYEKNNITSVKWKSTSNTWITMSITDAYQISYLATQKIQNIYIS
jgi:hypothetical protein